MLYLLLKTNYNCWTGIIVRWLTISQSLSITEAKLQNVKVVIKFVWTMFFKALNMFTFLIKCAESLHWLQEVGWFQIQFLRLINGYHIFLDFFFFCSFLSRKGRFPTATITSFSSPIVLLRPWQSLLIVALMPTQLLHPTFILSALFFYWKCRVFV